MKYMLTFRECAFNNGGVIYCNDQLEALREANKQRSMFGLTPEALYKYNPNTDRYDIMVGKYNVPI